ncbi:MAG TPA: 16S rRNA (cytidine(1402)-2'-O)-methyltransferase [Candidatus Eisenbacteria bacterium]|nr:16S rRNA (cytidine(1402)-2'-O)-methyltransferase [Candidatus Eisenbacteria bacterium]
MSGSLYIVPTPIGNLEDITFRAVRVLKEVDLIAAEDTRHTQVLLNHYDIRTSVTSYHEHNERGKARELVEQLRQGRSIALLSDAGTPMISDPGYRLVVEAIRAGVQVIPLPGPSAVTAALSAAGLPTDRFGFEGFLPAKKSERRSALEALKKDTKTLIFYEAPHRLKETLADMAEIFGDREVAIGREISKVHEEFLRGALREILATIEQQTVRGEITLVVQGATSGAPVTEEGVISEIRQLAENGMRVKEISELVGAHHGISKREVYRLALRVKNLK